MLQRRHAFFRKPLAQHAHEQCVLVVLNNRNYPLFYGLVRLRVAVSFHWTTGPSASRRIDAESENGFFLATTQPFIQPAYVGARGVT
jgi:hypothetical protein